MLFFWDMNKKNKKFIGVLNPLQPCTKKGGGTPFVIVTFLLGMQH
jgi:hypothetical protein